MADYPTLTVGKLLHNPFVFFSSRRRHTICYRDWSSDVCSSDLDRRRARVSDCCRQEFRRCRRCAECVAMRQHWTDPDAIEAEIASIRTLPLAALRRRWRVMFGRTPPAALSKDLLGRMMACRLQEQAFGSLDRESLRFLDGLARHGGAPRRQLKPGTVLVRDYHGQRHTVTVAADGFNWQGTTYASLSAIARAVADVFFFNRKSSAVKWSQRAAGFK